MKWDGIRALVKIEEGELNLISRSQRDLLDRNLDRVVDTHLTAAWALWALPGVPEGNGQHRCVNVARRPAA